MSNLTKDTTVGLDSVIDTIQKKVYELSDKWSVELTGYPRCYILQREKNVKVIEAYLGNGEYSGSLIHAEGNKFFFLSGDAIEAVSEQYFRTTIELYFMLNLNEVYPSILHRADEEVRVDVVNVLRTISGVSIVKIETNSDKVFSRFNNRISQSFEHEYTDDMHPYHYFKVLIDVLEYDVNQTKC
jgi:hypothetical protein